ncbi:MAG: hypothetical protein CMH56_05095 [Myxococcales bacterium]|nr:hypothetical protein [Myxococcales bacterium]
MSQCDPEPPGPNPADFESSCVYCHQYTPEALAEVAHPWAPLSCVDCHGGNRDAFTQEEAHIAKPQAVTSTYRHLATEELNNLNMDYLRFANPGDLRVAEISCGSKNPQSIVGVTGCHQGIVETTQRSVMSTFTGHYNIPRFLAGLQGREAAVGAVSLESQTDDQPMGTVMSIEPLLGPEPDSSDVGFVMDTYLVQACPKCHANAPGPNDAYGNYRSSGCTSCHMVYNDDGISRSLLQNISNPNNTDGQSPHPQTHQLTSAIPVAQCVHCHYQGARIGLMYQGKREAGGFKAQDEDGFPIDEAAPRPNHATYEGRAMFVNNRPSDFYIEYEDDDNDGLEDTPADLHHTAGLVCADCHIGSDVHGDGYLYSTGKFQAKIRCESCHGTVRETIQPNDEGFFTNSAGEPIKALYENEGKIYLRGKLSGKDHVVKQVKESLDNYPTWTNLQNAMGVNEDGYSHTDDIECHTCHTGWRQSCLGCHVTVGKGYRSRTPNYQTGTNELNYFEGERFFSSVKDIFLGMNHRGKISTVCPSEQMFISMKEKTDEGAATVMDMQVRRTATGKLGFGWQPNHPHTTQLVAQPCTLCHLKEDGSNEKAVKGVYGFGTGEFMLRDGEGQAYDLTQILDENGDPIVDFAHEGTGAVPPDVIQRAMEITVP